MYHKHSNLGHYGTTKKVKNAVTKKAANFGRCPEGEAYLLAKIAIEYNSKKRSKNFKMTKRTVKNVFSIGLIRFFSISVHF
jgi:hypothetical protein